MVDLAEVGELPVQAHCGGSVCSMCFLGSSEEAEVVLLFVEADVSCGFICATIDAFRKINATLSPAVLAVLSVGSRPKVGQTIVEAIAVCMIYLCCGLATVMQAPNNRMGWVGFPVKRYLDVRAIFGAADVAGFLARIARIPTDAFISIREVFEWPALPSDAPGKRVVNEALAKIISGWDRLTHGQSYSYWCVN